MRPLTFRPIALKLTDPKARPRDAEEIKLELLARSYVNAIVNNSDQAAARYGYRLHQFAVFEHRNSVFCSCRLQNDRTQTTMTHSIRGVPTPVIFFLVPIAGKRLLRAYDMPTHVKFAQGQPPTPF